MSAGRTRHAVKRARASKRAFQRARPAKRRKRHESGPFAALLAELREGRVPVQRIVRAWCGRGPVGRKWERDLLHTMRHMRVDDECIAAEYQGSEERECARRWLLLQLEVCSEMRRYGSEIQVRGTAAFWGKQHVQGELREAAELERARVQRSGELLAFEPIAPEDAWRRACGLLRRRQRKGVPKEQAGGLAARAGVSVRNVGRYSAIAHEARFIASQQPPRPGTRKQGKAEAKAPVRDAVMPKGGDWPYPVWHFPKGRQIAEAIMKTLRIAWGELVVAEPTSEPTPVHGLAKQPPVYQGARAPPLPVAEIAAAHPELDAMDDMDTLALAKLREQYGTRDHDKPRA